jgi:hypothetical protein
MTALAVKCRQAPSSRECGRWSKTHDSSVSRPDDDLLRWLAGMEGQPYGAKSQAVKEALRRGLGMNSPAAPAGAAVDLAEIRAVVEAAVEAALARLEGAVVARPAPDAADDEAERLLDTLGEALVL